LISSGPIRVIVCVLELRESVDGPPLHFLQTGESDLWCVVYCTRRPDTILVDLDWVFSPLMIRFLAPDGAPTTSIGVVALKSAWMCRSLPSR
jgi:hypothetical protein